MADFTSKLQQLSGRGSPVGAEELIGRIEAELAGDPLVVVTKRREGVFMTKTDQPVTTESPGPWRGLAWALTGFVVILAVGGFYFAFNGDDDVVADPIPMTDAEAVAMAFLAAAAEHDREAATELLKPDVAPPAVMRGWDHDRAVGSVLRNPECEEGATGPEGTIVTCSIDVVIDVSEALGLEPGTARYTFVVDDAQIRSANPHVTDLRGLQEASDTFLAWMATEHPEDIETMGPNLLGGQRLTPESIALWERYTDEYLASLEE